MYDSRLYRDGPDGPIYRVSIHPRELADGRGISKWVNSVVFQDIVTGRVLSAPIHNAWELGELTDRDLTILFEQART